MRTQTAIEKILRAHFAVQHLEVINESSQHNVPAGSESHFKVVIVSAKFNGLPLMARHRDVMQWVHAHEDDFDCANCGEAVKGFLIRISEAIRDPRFARVAQNEAFVQLLGWSLVAIHQQGIEKAIDSLLAR